MPLTRSAIKKLRKDVKREKQNDVFRKELKDVLSKAKKTKEKNLAKKATSLIDKAVKKHVLHKNKASRLKSNLMKKFNEKTVEKSAKQTKSKVVKKRSSVKKTLKPAVTSL